MEGRLQTRKCTTRKASRSTRPKSSPTGCSCSAAGARRRRRWRRAEFDVVGTTPTASGRREDAGGGHVAAAGAHRAAAGRPKKTADDFDDDIPF